MTDSERQEVRDKIAGLLGWERNDKCVHHRFNRRTSDVSGNHPVPLTLDGLAALWPEGWEFAVSTAGRGMLEAEGWNSDKGVPSANSIFFYEPVEYDARLLLLCAVLESEKGKEKA